MQESQDKSKHNETKKKIAELKSIRDKPMTKTDNVESDMMMLGVHREFGRKRTTRGTREDGEQTRRNNGKTKT